MISNLSPAFSTFSCERTNTATDVGLYIHESLCLPIDLSSLKNKMASTDELLKVLCVQNVIFNKLSVHLQSCQCLVLYVKTLIILPKKCQATSSRVSGLCP